MIATYDPNQQAKDDFKARSALHVYWLVLACGGSEKTAMKSMAYVIHKT